MDLDGLLGVLRSLEAGEIRTVAVDTPEPSPFCHEILNANPYAFLDDAPLEERRARAVQLRRTIRGDADGAGILSAEAIAEVAEESWPVVRDADELHDALATLVALPPVAQWAAWYEELVAERRATALVSPAGTFWTSAERLTLAQAAYPDATLDPAIDAVTHDTVPEEREAAVAEILRGWLESTGPVTSLELSERFGVDLQTIDAALIRLETQGQLLRGRFRGGETEEWCNRRVLARIHRRTLGTLRR